MGEIIYLVRNQEKMVKHSSRIELKQSAYKSNINFIRKKIGEKPILSSVVKANAYGHGIESFRALWPKNVAINHSVWLLPF